MKKELSPRDKRIITAVVLAVIVIIGIVVAVVFLKKDTKEEPKLETDTTVIETQTLENPKTESETEAQTENTVTKSTEKEIQDKTESQTYPDEYEVTAEYTDVEAKVRLNSQNKKELYVTIHQEMAYIRRLSLERKGKAVTVRAFASGEGEKAGSIAVPLDNVDEVYFYGYIIYQNGRVIDISTMDLLCFSTLDGTNTDVLTYCMAASRIEPIPMIEDNIHDEPPMNEPYIVRFEYLENLNRQEKIKAQHTAYLFMALYNIERIEISDSKGFKKMVTIDDANRDFKIELVKYNAKNKVRETFKGSVTDYTENEYDLQLLRDVLDI